MPKFEYAPAPESRAIVSLRESYGLFIGGEFTPGVDGRAFKTISPATEEVLAEVTEAGPADKLEYAGYGPAPRPLGVAGQVIPWNFPLLMLAWKIAPALACGNTVVLKPAETTPLTALAFAEICQQADLPPGVVNIITGAGETGRALVTHPGIDKVAFTGSTEVGKAIARACAPSRTKVTLELGGKAANIVLEDAPVDQAVEGIVNGIFFNQGHVCCAGSRLLVQESVYSEVLAALRRRLETLRLGDPLDKNTDVGAINSAAQLAKIRELSEVGEAEGAQRWSPPCELPVKGFWFPPTVFTGVSQAHRIAREEIFGPVLSVLTFRTPAEALEKANNTPYGLSAGVWTEKGSLILWMASRLRAGVVWANTFNKFDPTSPFGGYKESGYGREDGRHAVVAARKAFGGWSAATAYNRGQVLYRVAELLEGRRAQFAAEVRSAEGVGARQAEAVVDGAVDRWVWYAGWADKLTQVRGAANPVAGPYFNFSLPEPTGVVAVVAPQASSLLGFVSVVAV